MFDYIKDNYNQMRASSRRAATGAVNYFPVMILALALMLIMFFLLSGRGEQSALSLTLEKEEAKGKGADVASGLTDKKNSAASADKAAVRPEKFIQVHIAGAVFHPGLYKLADGLRINDGAIEAGGLLSSADSDAVNLAEKLKDGTQVYIPFKNEGISAPAVAGAASGLKASSASSATSSRSSPATSQSGSEKPLINLNQASALDLEALPGIGPVMSEKIISYREKNGSFKSLEELKNVPGIGDKKFAEMKSGLTL